MKNELRSRWQVITAVAHHFTYVLCTYPSFANTNPRGAEHGYVWDLDSLSSLSVPGILSPTIFAQVRLVFEMEPLWACSPLAFLGMLLEENDEDSYKT